MNTEIIEYFKKLSQREFFVINFINSVLGVVIIILGFVALNSEITIPAYVAMFTCGAIMLGLNFFKGCRKNNKNRWIFLAAAIIFAIMAVLFLISG